MPPKRPPDPPDDVGVNELWEAVKERSSWWLPAMGVGCLGYSVVFLAMFFIGGMAMWDVSKVLRATNIIVLLMLPMLATIIWLSRSYVYEALAAPEGKPDYTWAQVKENHSLWNEAIEEYRKVYKEHPLDAESLFRIATIYRDRLEDEDQYLAMLSEIVQLPDDAEPAWILVEARDRLLRLGDADVERGPVHERPTEIELPDDAAPWGRFGPEE